MEKKKKKIVGPWQEADFSTTKCDKVAVCAESVVGFFSLLI